MLTYSHKNKKVSQFWVGYMSLLIIRQKIPRSSSSENGHIIYHRNCKANQEVIANQKKINYWYDYALHKNIVVKVVGEIIYSLYTKYFSWLHVSPSIKVI